MSVEQDKSRPAHLDCDATNKDDLGK